MNWNNGEEPSHKDTPMTVAEGFAFFAECLVLAMGDSDVLALFVLIVALIAIYGLLCLCAVVWRHRRWRRSYRLAEPDPETENWRIR